jgi:hypothetical protein
MGALVAGGFVLAPRAARLLGSVLAGVTVSDFLNTAYEAANKTMSSKE